MATNQSDFYFMILFLNHFLFFFQRTTLPIILKRDSPIRGICSAATACSLKHTSLFLHFQNSGSVRFVCFLKQDYFVY